MTSETFRNQGLFLRNQFKGEGIFEIPIVKKQHVNVETVTLIGYDHVKTEEKEFTHAMVHFFLDDYKFEVLWNNPEPRIKKLAQYRAVLTPQYSLYTEMPMTLQLYNTFRNRWVGACLQSRGLQSYQLSAGEHRKVIGSVLTVWKQVLSLLYPHWVYVLKRSCSCTDIRKS